MGDYGIVAFYRETESEVSGPAEALMQIYHLHLRYEKVPQFPEAIAN